VSTYEPHGTRFYDARSGRMMLLVEEPGHPNDGWLCFRHVDGQWVTLRKATAGESSRPSRGRVVHARKESP
jgi:hypothetical protein